MKIMFSDTDQYFVAKQQASLINVYDSCSHTLFFVRNLISMLQISSLANLIILLKVIFNLFSGIDICVMIAIL